MNDYGWLIDESFIEEGSWNPDTDVRTGVLMTIFGPSDISDKMVSNLTQGAGDAFELYDDDMILYYKGRIIGDYEGFEPLTDFGTPNAGAVHIKIEGEWV